MPFVSAGPFRDGCPPQHRTNLHSTNPIEGLNGEIKRLTEVVGIFRTSWSEQWAG
jgi:transposase-like protein